MRKYVMPASWWFLKLAATAACTAGISVFLSCTGGFSGRITQFLLYVVVFAGLWQLQLITVVKITSVPLLILFMLGFTGLMFFFYILLEPTVQQLQ